MAVNLTPQYHRAEEEYRRATTAEEEVRCLEVMLKEIPKHKASEKLQSELKQRLSRARQEAETERKVGKSSRPGVRIPRQGAGTALLLGAPNVGKSQLLATLTRANPEVADYPFTTREPLPGMMPWEDVMVQLLDTPPITPDFMETYMQGLIRAADVVLLVVNLGDDSGVEDLQAVLDRLLTTKTRLGRESYLDENDIGLSYTKTLLVGNQVDRPGAMERLELLHELCPLDFDEHMFSATTGSGLDALRTAIYRALDVVRVYTKLPTSKAADMDKPYTVKRGGTVADIAALIHNDLARNLKSARVWGEAVHGVAVMKPDYEVHDRDIVELHTS